jgi:rhodanese-related sulfurtransferase
MDEGLKMMADSSDYILLDVRRPDEFASGHIPGAILFTNELMTKADAEKLLPNKGQRIFVYCRSGRRSKEASQKLVVYGYSNVIEIGGILDYSGVIEK